MSPPEASLSWRIQECERRLTEIEKIIRDANIAVLFERVEAQGRSFRDFRKEVREHNEKQEEEMKGLRGAWRTLAISLLASTIMVTLTTLLILARTGSP